MQKILTLNPWQLFALLIIPAFFSSIVTYGFWHFIFIGWFFILGTNLHSKLPSGDKPSLTFFIFNCCFAFLYSLTISIVFPNGFIISNENIDEFGTVGYIILPFHFYTMYALLYAIYFITKSIKSIEKRSIVVFDEYVGYFFLLWFFPIGIWWLQPKIKNIFSDKENANTQHALAKMRGRHATLNIQPN